MKTVSAGGGSEGLWPVERYLSLLGNCCACGITLTATTGGADFIAHVMIPDEENA